MFLYLIEKVEYQNMSLLVYINYQWIYRINLIKESLRKYAVVFNWRIQY